MSDVSTISKYLDRVNTIIQTVIAAGIVGIFAVLIGLKVDVAVLNQTLIDLDRRVTVLENND